MDVVHVVFLSFKCWVLTMGCLQERERERERESVLERVQRVKKSRESERMTAQLPLIWSGVLGYREKESEGLLPLVDIMVRRLGALPVSCRGPRSTALHHIREPGLVRPLRVMWSWSYSSSSPQLQGMVPSYL